MEDTPPPDEAAAIHQPANVLRAAGMSSTATIAITIPEAACNAQFSRRGEVFQNSATIPPAKLPSPGSSESRRTYQSILAFPLCSRFPGTVPSGATPWLSVLRDDGAVVAVIVQIGRAHV